MATISIDESRVNHILRDAPGHLRDDNRKNRQILIDVANKPTNFLGTDRSGNDWYAEALTDGTEVWVRVPDKRIVNGGLNQSPRNAEGLPR